jgi:cation-transporting ATPase E
MRNVLMRAVPGGLAVTLSCLGAMLAAGPLGLGAGETSTVCTLAAGVTGLAVLLLTCLPLDRLRAGLVLLMAAAMAGAVLVVPQVFYLVPLMGYAPWVLVGAMGLAMAVLWAATRLMPKDRA